MKTLDFYGRTIRVKDISFCEKRRTKTFEVVIIIWHIIGYIAFIAFIGIILGIHFYNFSTHIYDVFGLKLGISIDDDVSMKYISVFFFFFGYGFLHSVIIGLIHTILGRNKIVVIILVSGEKIKSPPIPDSDALSLNTYISKILKGENT